jgi:hypothetical protein
MLPSEPELGTLWAQTRVRFPINGKRPIRELTAEPATAVHRPLTARDRQRLADERMPAVVDGDGALKLRSM